MLRSSGTMKATALKEGREFQNHDKVQPDSHTSVHLEDFSEKSLLVLQNYIYMEKNRKQTAHMFRGQGDAFINDETVRVNDDSARINLNLHPELWEASNKVSKRNNKAIVKKKENRKQRSWMPNGGGIKPYDSSAVHKSVLPEECIIDIKAVKPKVDTWFRLKPKNRDKEPLVLQGVPKTNQSGQTLHHNAILKKATTTVVTHHVSSALTAATGVADTDGDLKVKNLTTFWNDHLQKHPLTSAQKSSTAKTGKDQANFGGPVKSKSRKLEPCRPKSVGSDGVIQEHTLQPSKILSEKKKMSSVEDILVFAKMSGTRNSAGDAPEKLLENHQFIKRKSRPENSSTQKTSNIPKKNISNIHFNTPLKNAETKSVGAKFEVRGVKKTHRPEHPKFVVRLHPRWILALRVLTLSFRPIAEMWKRKCSSLEKSGLLKLTCGDLLPAELSSSSCIASGKVIKESLVSSVKMCSDRFGKLKRLARQGMSDTLRILTDTTRMKENTTSASYAVVTSNTPSFFSRGRFPLVTEPMPRSPEFRAVYTTPVMKTASIEVMPRGVRIGLYVEYQFVFSFILIQSILLAIVLLFKWLQEYTM